jgi:hypothetical protein
MRGPGLGPLYVVALVAWWSGRRQGREEGTRDGFGKAAAIYTAGLLKK